MIRNSRFIILVAVVLAFSVLHTARGAETDPKPADRTVSTVKRLQGRWVGRSGTDVNGDEVTITIKGDSFRFHRDEGFWFDTTIALIEGTAPQQLLATIIRCAPEQGSPTGKVVPAIFKIEDGTMTIGAFAEIEDPPKSFQDISTDSLYTLRRAPSQDLAGPVPESQGAEGNSR